MRAMYNTSLCYSMGEGLVPNHRLARKWMKRAADRGHCKAQFEHGLGLFSVCNPDIVLLSLEFKYESSFFITFLTNLKNRF